MDKRNERLGPTGQRLVPAPTNSASTSSGISDTSGLIGVRPVLNYSIQTGEEFSLEFMRERVVSKKPSGSNSSADQSFTTNYMDLRGVLGLSQGSESASDISSNKNQYKEVDKKRLLENDTKNLNFTSVRSMQRVPSGEGSSRGGVSYGYSSGASDTSLKKTKVLCSYGGKILPRPSDGKLRYVGGETRIIGINKYLSWQELLQKTTSMYNQPHTVKYQLPGEDLDALVSVSCDEDLQNMMEECSFLDYGEGSQKLRIFLFPNDGEDLHFSLGSIEGDSEIQYVVAVNGMDVVVGKTSSDHVRTTASASELDRLVDLNVDADRVQANKVPTETANMPIPHNLLSPTSLALPQSLSSDYGTNLLSYDSRMQYVEGSHQLYSVSNALDSFQNVNSKSSIPLSIPLDHYSHSQYVPLGGNSTSIPLFDLPTKAQLGSEGQHGVARTVVQNVPLTDTKVEADILAIQKKESDNFPFRENEYTAPINPDMSHIPSTPDNVASLLPLKNNGLEAAVLSKADATVRSGLASRFNEDECYASSTVITSECSDYEAGIADLSYRDPLPGPPRGFHSERIPREQAELLNRLSKSDDSIGSQLLNLQPYSGAVQESVIEAADFSLQASTISQTERFSAAKPPKPNTTTLGGGLLQFEEYKELADTSKKMNRDDADEPPTSSMDLNVQDQKTESSNNHKVLDGNAREWSDPNAGRQLDYSGTAEPTTIGGSYKEMLIDGIKVAATVSKQPDIPASVLPDIRWEEIPTSTPHLNTVGEHVQEFPWAGSSAGVVLQAESSYPPTEPRDMATDINDPFPRNLLADIFAKARIDKDPAGVSPLCKDDAGISLNMPKHEPQRWSFFRNLANEFARKDVSLIDQDHLGFSPPPKIEDGDHRSYKFSPFDNEEIDLSRMESQIEFDEEMQEESSGNIEDDANDVHKNYISSQFSQPHLMDKVGESFQVENPYAMVGESFQVENPYAMVGENELRFAIAEACGPAFDTEIDFNNLQIIKNEDLEELRELGSGTFGTVYHGKWRGTDVAIKRIKKSCFTGRSSEQERLTQEFWREAEILSKLHHPNVVAFYGVVQDGPGGTLATVTEFMVNGSLRHVLLRKDKYLDRRKRLIIAMDAAFGMEYLHSKNIVHFDLKCDNLLVNLKDQSRPICKVGDFGLSKIKRNTLVSGGVRGTLPWMAPELLNGSSNRVSEKVDVFSFGIVMWEILTGEEPYANMHYGAIIGGIVNNTLRPPIPTTCDPEWRKLMEQCWAPDPQQRPSFTQITSRLRSMSQSKPTK
ncbi:hypothetical protein HPP92_013032 [Vanilla planifolia]|uniref:Protein kinase domain-containing protein n=1 Tax=Vanilla planifolia TaxID=51239 RepID=A0A835QS87_VANPL|nr:hypothetical protein HPP92_013032 [Vanilla planifolia]